MGNLLTTAARGAGSGPPRERRQPTSQGKSAGASPGDASPSLFKAPRADVGNAVMRLKDLADYG